MVPENGSTLPCRAKNPLCSSYGGSTLRSVGKQSTCRVEHGDEWNSEECPPSEEDGLGTLHSVLKILVRPSAENRKQQLKREIALG